MGRIKLCCVMLFVIIVFCCWGFSFISSQTGELTALLEHTEQLAESGSKKEAIDSAKELEKVWEEYQDIASIFVRNDKISGAQTSMTRLCSMIKNESEELGAEFSNARSCLEWIVESEMPKIYNIL